MAREYRHDRCNYCKRPFTPEQIEARKAERAQNLKNSRAKARANGTPLGRRKVGDKELIFKLKNLGHSIRGIARLSNVSTTAVSRRIRELKDEGRL